MSQRSVVHIVDDDAAMRTRFQQLMESADLPTRLYASAEEFLENLGPECSGCIVLDLRMPGMGGLELLRRLRGDGREIPVIVVSGHADIPAAVRGMKLGAIDVLPKPFEPQVLILTVRNALEKSVQLQKLRNEREAIRARFAALTARELELMKLVVGGSPNKQIADRLGISIKTVANHRANLMIKIQALNAADLARLSTIAGITP